MNQAISILKYLKERVGKETLFKNIIKHYEITRINKF